MGKSEMGPKLTREGGRVEGGSGGTAQQASEALYSCIVAVLSVAFLIRPFLVAMTLAIAANLLTSKDLPARPRLPPCGRLEA